MMKKQTLMFQKPLGLLFLNEECLCCLVSVLGTKILAWKGYPHFGVFIVKLLVMM